MSIQQQIMPYVNPCTCWHIHPFLFLFFLLNWQQILQCLQWFICAVTKIMGKKVWYFFHNGGGFRKKVHKVFLRSRFICNFQHKSVNKTSRAEGNSTKMGWTCAIQCVVLRVIGLLYQDDWLLVKYSLIELIFIQSSRYIWKLIMVEMSFSSSLHNVRATIFPFS